MRASQGQVVRYVPGQVPEGDLVRFLRQELQAISFALSAVQDGQIDVTTVAPSKPRDGMIRRSDGVSWLPNGVGAAGVWCYYAGSWKFLG